MKKMLTIMLALAFVLGCMTGAMAETDRVGTTLFPCDANGYPNLGGVTIDIWETTDSTTVEFATTYSDMWVIQQYEQMLNCDLTFRMAPVGEQSENFTLMIASQDLPDLIFDDGVTSYYKGGITMAYDDGLIYDYTELVSPETTPAYWAYVMEDPYMSKLAVDDYGRNVKLGSRVSGSEESCTCMWGMMIRSDYLAQTGLDLPETIDDWTEMLRAFKNIGVKYPMLLNKSGYWKSRNAFSGAWNIDARSFFITADGEIAYGPATEEYRDYIGTIAMWYGEGLINPDYLTDTQSDTWAMIANNEAGCVVDHTYAYASNYYEVVEKNDPSVALVAAQMPKLNESDDLTHVMVTNRGISNDKCITADSSLKKECVALLDTMYYPEIEFMFSNGKEGLGYNLNEAGYPVITDIEDKADATDEEKRCMRLHQWETESDSDYEYIVTSKYCYGVQPQTVNLYRQCGYDRYLTGNTFTVEEAEVVGEYMTDVETYRDEMMAKFINGELDIHDDGVWQNYLDTLNQIGLQELQEVYASSYARFASR